MNADKVNALRADITALASQLALLQAKAAELTSETPTTGTNVEQALPASCAQPAPPYAPHLVPHLEDCHCRCRLLTRGPSTQAPGVYLGLVRAADVLALGERARKDLEIGLKLIVQHLVPRGPGTALTTTPADLLTKCSSDMAALLDKVSLRADPLPVDSEPNFEAFRNTGRGRYRRLGDVRQGYLGALAAGARRCAAHFETLLQLVLFFGIDVEALP